MKKSGESVYPQHALYKFEGLLVYESRNEHGVVEIVDTQGVRALHFGSHSRQSTMLLAEPEQLHSLYARAMMGVLLFNDSPKNVLMIGLGGGTITKYLLNQFPDCRIDVVEFQQEVVNVAHHYFGLPTDERLNIKVGCGAEHVHQNSRQHQQKYDLIMVDAFDHEGMAQEINNEGFFYHCQTLLADEGVFAINLWGNNKDEFQSVTWNLGSVFDWKILFLPVRKRGNIVGFGFAEKTEKMSIKALKAKAKQLEKKYQLGFPEFVADFKRNNSFILNRVFKK